MDDITSLRTISAESKTLHFQNPTFLFDVHNHNYLFPNFIASHVTLVVCSGLGDAAEPQQLQVQLLQ